MHIGDNVDVIIRIVGGKRFPLSVEGLGAAIARDGRTFSVNDQIVDSRISLSTKLTGSLTNFFQFPFNGLFRSRDVVWLEC